MKRYQALAAIFAVIAASSIVEAHAQSDYVGTGDFNKYVSTQEQRLSAVDTLIDNNSAAQDKVNKALSDRATKSEAKIEQLVQDGRADRKEYQAGISGAMAMAAVPQVMPEQTHFVGVAGGSYANGQALAVGYSVRATDRAVLKVNASFDNNSNFGASVGIGMGW